MFLSGRWRGYWEQLAYGRQSMETLVLRFADGVISGEGRDCIGPFTFAGTYDASGAVVMVKQYLGRHSVTYQGRYDGEGTIFGRWSIGSAWAGPFALSPVLQRPPPDAPIERL